MNDAKEDGARDRALQARRNLRDAAAWFALGAAIFAASWSMDRLQNQGINPYTIPGLLPGLLGIAMMILGALLALRSIGEGALMCPAPAPGASPGGRGQLLLTLALCLVFTGALLGHGLPFWLAAAIFVAASILTLHRAQAEPKRSRLREAATATLIGLCAGGAITLVFQVLFLVRLP
jgi:hypothetical protein